MTVALFLTRVWHCGGHRLRIDVPRPVPGQPLRCIVRWPKCQRLVEVTEVAAILKDFERGRDEILDMVERELGVRPEVVDEADRSRVWLLPPLSNEPGSAAASEASA